MTIEILNTQYRDMLGWMVKSEPLPAIPLVMVKIDPGSIALLFQGCLDFIAQKPKEVCNALLEDARNQHPDKEYLDMPVQLFDLPAGDIFVALPRDLQNQLVQMMAATLIDKMKSVMKEETDKREEEKLNA